MGAAKQRVDSIMKPLTRSCKYVRTMIKFTKRVAMFGSEERKKAAREFLETTTSEAWVLASIMADASVELMPVICAADRADIYIYIYISVLATRDICLMPVAMIQNWHLFFSRIN